MSSDMFFKFEGLPGGSLDAKHAKEIDVLAFSWGMHNPSNPHQGSGSGAGKVNVQNLQFVKPLDQASTGLLMKCAQGHHFSKATLVVRKASGASGGPLEYLTITLFEVYINSIGIALGAGQTQMTENVTISFAKFLVSMQPQDATGGKLGGAMDIGFNIKTNSVDK